MAKIRDGSYFSRKLVAVTRFERRGPAIEQNCDAQRRENSSLLQWTAIGMIRRLCGLSGELRRGIRLRASTRNLDNPIRSTWVLANAGPLLGSSEVRRQGWRYSERRIGWMITGVAYPPLILICRHSPEMKTRERWLSRTGWGLGNDFSRPV